MAADRQPERTCVGCRTKAAKSDLLRVVRRSDGGVAIDSTGKEPGRGAYVHAKERCMETAIRTRALSRALRTQIPADRASSLIQEVIKARESGSADP